MISKIIDGEKKTMIKLNWLVAKSKILVETIYTKSESVKDLIIFYFFLELLIYSN